MPHYHKDTLTDEAETDVEVTYTATGGHGGVYSVPWESEPPEAPEIEIISVMRLSDGAPLTLSDADADRITQWLAENHQDDDDDYGWED
jgi:hypothetical protein